MRLQVKMSLFLCGLVQIVNCGFKGEQPQRNLVVIAYINELHGVKTPSPKKSHGVKTPSPKKSFMQKKDYDLNSDEESNGVSSVDDSGSETDWELLNSEAIDPFYANGRQGSFRGRTPKISPSASRDSLSLEVLSPLTGYSLGCTPKHPVKTPPKK